jgi:outer membrane protein OmpA-like peptidoglycan-associated protein
MRSVITEISSKLFGLSILVFILGLLIPLLRGSPAPAEKGDTVEYELSSSPKKTNQRLELEHTQSRTIDDGLQSPITQPQGKATLNQSNELTASAQNEGLQQQRTQNPIDDGLHPPITQPQDEVTQDQSNGLTESTQPVGDSGFPSPVVESKRSSQHESISLLVLGGGFFSSGQVTPSADIQEAIDKIIPLIQTRPLDNVVVEGHADKWVPNGVSPVQISKLNQSISLRRANAIALVLKQKGIASDRIIVHGLGDAVPLASNRTQEGRTKNRRVEIKLLPAQ